MICVSGFGALETMTGPVPGMCRECGTIVGEAATICDACDYSSKETDETE
jgi:hypothetical protein